MSGLEWGDVLLVVGLAVVLLNLGTWRPDNTRRHSRDTKRRLRAEGLSETSSAQAEGGNLRGKPASAGEFEDKRGE